MIQSERWYRESSGKRALDPLVELSHREDLTDYQVQEAVKLILRFRVPTFPNFDEDAKIEISEELLPHLEELVEAGDVVTLESMEDTFKVVEEYAMERGETFGQELFRARLISWGVPSDKTEDIAEMLASIIYPHPHLSLADYTEIKHLVEEADNAYDAILERYRELNTDYMIGDVLGFLREFTEDSIGSATSWEVKAVHMWSEVSDYIGQIPHKDFWDGLEQAESPQEVTEIFRKHMEA